MASLVPLDADRYLQFISKNRDGKNILSWLGDAAHLYRWQEYYNALTVQMARAFGCRLVDLRTAFLQSRNFLDLLCPDGIHPTDSGYALALKPSPPPCIDNARAELGRGGQLCPPAIYRTSLISMRRGIQGQGLGPIEWGVGKPPEVSPRFSFLFSPGAAVLFFVKKRKKRKGAQRKWAANGRPYQALF